jgi:hypothetical protein
MKQVLTEERFAAFIGIDWADAKHDLCLQADGCATSDSTPRRTWNYSFRNNWRSGSHSNHARIL